ncbi:MAG: glycosyltransferase family 4 protein [Candidatus Eremiobacteraeota bacterium]|nr:glycosyltransferase family 4 protein [Candidatus Eremiobacteraeota bacterium]
MLKVALDAQQTVGTATGIGEYVRGLLGALPEAGIEPIPLRVTSFDPWRFDRRVVWDQALLPLAALRSGAALLHCTSGSLPVASPLPVVATVHDLAWARAQEHAPFYARWYFGRFSARRWNGARAVIVDSAFTRDELLATSSLEPERIVVVHPGVDRAFGLVARNPDPAAVLLAVGTVERRKNVAVVIAALAELEGARLVCVGPRTPYQDECLALARRLGVSERVAFPGYVGRDELLALYARSSIAVVPSRYEGFGYGAAQALCAGIPLVAARTSSLVEVVGDDAPLLSPDDSAAWALACREILANREEAERRAAATRARALVRFSWEASAAATASVYRTALANRRAFAAG